nr:FUSC family protein [Neoroseomonas oryzicola]
MPAGPGADPASLDGLADAPGAEPLRPIIARLQRAFAQAAAPAIGEGAARPAPPAPPSPWTTLRAQLTPRSAVARHAARIGLAAGLATAATLPWPAGHAYWMTISLILTLQPDVAQTMARAAERTGGTFAGALLGAGIALLLPSPMTMAGVLLPLAATTAALRRVSYGAYVGGATAVIVVLLEVDHPGQAEALRIGLERAGYTLAGGGLALLAAVALWPDWAGERLDPVLRAAVAAHLRYAALGIAERLGEADAATSLSVRREVGATSAEAEALLQRVLLEHVRARTEAFRGALAIDAALRRAGGQIAALRLAEPAGDPAGAAAWRAWFDAAAAAVAAGGALPPAPPGCDDPVLADIAAQLMAAAEALAGLGVP